MDPDSVLRTLKKWVDLILKDDLVDVARESKGVGCWKIDAASNKTIFRAILNLSHSADRAKPAQTGTGKQIFKIAKNLCSSMTEMPDLLKFYAALFHIVKKLILMKFYAEAMEITRFCFPGRLVRGLESAHLDMYPKIANLWQDAGAELVDALTCSFDETKYKLVLEFLKNELSVLEVIAKDRTSYVLIRTLRYLTKLEGIRVDLSLAGDKNHRNVAKTFLDRIQTAPRGEEKYEAYREALKFLNSTTLDIKDSTKKALTVFTESYEMLKPIFAKDKELNSCFLIYKNMGAMIFETAVSPSSQISHWNIERLKKETIAITDKFTERKAVLWNMKFIGYILQPLFERWDDSIKSGKLCYLSTNSLCEIISLIRLMYLVLNSIPTTKCEICTNGDCTLRKYIYTVTIVSTKCLVTIAKQSSACLIKDIFDQVKELLGDNVAAIFEMKEANCSMWSILWSNCGVNIYNLGATLHKLYYEEAVYLFSLLASSIVKFEGLNATESKINIKDALPYVLYRISSVHYHRGKYREALTPCALGGLLSYRSEDNKIFRMWGIIKSACSGSSSILELTMVGCLEEDKESIKEIGDVNLDEYDLKELCIQELRGLHDAKSNLHLAIDAALKQLQALSCTTLQYAQGVQMLGYHLLHYKFDMNFSWHLNRAKRKMGEEKCLTDSHLLTNASLDFYTFVLDLKDAADQTKIEMEKSKFAVRASKSVDIDGQPPKTDGVVPAYSKIKVTEDSKLFANLQLAVEKWTVCIENNICAPNDWQSLLTLHTLVLAAEYSRLHRFSTLENRSWDLAYELSRQLKDSRTCIYVVGRSMLSRSVNAEWVDTGKDLMNKLTESTDAETNTAVSFFKVGLSSLYFDIGKHEEAVALLHGIILLPRTHVINNATSYVSGMVTILRNYRFCMNQEEGTNYMVFLVRCLYSIAALMDYTPTPRVGVKGKELHTSDVLLTSTSYISLQVNSLLSFREITSHLLNRLKISQAVGATLRVAECLKHLCFIDLSHVQLDDCMVKLQGLEFILQTEYIEESKNSKNPGSLTAERGHSDASPILRKTVFRVPDFFTHKNCLCYKCSCVDYQYLVTSSVHIRAQLYFLQGNNDEALEHFAGAFDLRVKMLEVEMTRVQSENNKGRRYPWNCYYRTVEFVLLLVDFSRCIWVLGADDRDGMAIAKDAVDFCEQFHLNNHPIYFTAKELLLEYQFHQVFSEEGCFSKFTVPDPDDIDISMFVNLDENVNPSNINTPASKPIVKKPRTVRRVKTPPMLKLTKVTMILSDDEDEENVKDVEDRIDSPKTSRQRTKGSRNYKASKSVPRRKLESFLTEDNEEEPPIEVEIIESDSEDCKLVNEVMKTTSSFFPHLKNELIEIADDSTKKDSEKIDMMKKLVKKHEMSSDSDTGSLDSRPQRKTKSRNLNKKKDEAVDEVTDSMNAIIIDDKKNVPKIIVESSSSSQSDDPGFVSAMKSERRVKSEDGRLKNLLTPDNVQKQREKIKASDRTKRSKSQSAEEKPKTSTRSRIKSAEENGRSRGSKRIEKSKSEVVYDLSDSDESLKNKDKETRGRTRKYQPRATKALRSRSPGLEVIANDSDIVPMSDHEEVESELSKKLKTLSRVKQSTTAEKTETGTRKRRPNLATRATRATRALRSRSPGMEITANDSDIVPMSDHEEVQSKLNKKPKALSRIRKSPMEN